MKRLAASTGFTLLEVILAIALAAGLVLSLLAFLDYASDVRASATRDISELAAEQLVMDLATRELRAATVDNFVGQAMNGSAEEITFVMSSVPGPSAWAVRKSTEDPLPPQSDLQRITYRLSKSVDANGLPVVNGVERAVQKSLSTAAVQEGQGIATQMLASEVKFLMLRYWDGANWQTSWGGSSLPAAVEVNIGFTPLPENTDPLQYPFECFHRVIYLPGSNVAPPTTGGGPG